MSRERRGSLKRMPADLKVLDWLGDCLQTARDFVPYTRVHFRDHVAEAAAEVRFYTAASNRRKTTSAEQLDTRLAVGGG
jgi:hypothetical protein